VGQLYGYRVDGPFAPEDGQRFNPAKLLLDPYARALTGRFTWNDALLGYTRDHLRADLSRDPRNSAGFLPKCRVVDPAFAWEGDRPPAIPWDRTVIYEAHVRGLTRLHPRVPEPLRGRYLGIASEPMLDHLLKLGITAIELLPIHAFMTDGTLVERGLTNYWGYQSLGFFAPEGRYASGSEGEQVTEFQQMVRALHRAGLEVILDVVYNHTASTTSRTTAWPPIVAATTRISAAAATPWTSRGRRSSTSSSTRSATGSRSCTSTVFASTWPPRWGARRRITAPARSCSAASPPIPCWRG
jgi:glycogen operon protein